MSASRKREPTLIESLIPVIFLIVFLAINVYVFKDDSLAGSNQIVLILSATVAAIIASRTGIKWLKLREGIVRTLTSALPSILILLLIGSLAGSWLISGIIPAMIYYGLKIINPTIFLFAACVVSSIVSLATGSSWSTVATLGVALLGIGVTHGYHEGVVAGAIISGAYFGDKMSPLSDTTNLAPAMAGTDLFTHIRYMALTTGPSITLTLLIFLVIGFHSTTSGTENDFKEVLMAIDGSFNIHWGLFVVPAMVIFMIVRKVSPLPALLAGTILGAVVALIFQPEIVEEVAGISGNPLKVMYVGVMKALYTIVSVETSNARVNELLTSGGMAGMLNTIWLIVCAMVYGGIMDAAGFLERITLSIIRYARSTGSLIASTAGTCVFFNLTASDQYLAIVVPGRMFASTYEKRGLAPENLSRTLEDSGTVTSVLVPWNTCGAYQSSVLGVATITYLPYCFFNIISPFMTIFFAYMGIKIRKLKTGKTKIKIEA
ncbi:MAG: Na+/H+ antiporter NhaC [Cyclobacteriaceae bacterium]|nr:Na+/H+ antiporter NhaC [Cyclobacteriaceae bacterium]